MRRAWMAGLVALGLLAAACGGGTTGTQSPGGGATVQPTGEAPGQGEGLKIAFVYDGTTDDGGWNTSHHAGLEYVKENLPGAEFTELEEIAPGDQARATFQDLAAQGFNLIVGTTYYEPDVLAVAGDFPDTKFLTWGGTETAENVSQYDLATEDGRYLDGIVAGSISERNLIGYPAGFPIPEVVRGINAFVLGAQSVNPDVTVIPLMINSWYDPPKEREAAQSLANQGVDILVHELNSPAVATVAERNGIHVIGYGWNQEARSPSSWLSSFIFNWGPYYLEQAQAVIDGDWSSGRFYGGLGEDAITMSPFGPDVPQDVVDLVNQRMQEIASGELDVLAGPITDNKGSVQVPEGSTIPKEERAACCDWYAEGVRGSVPTG
jgi:basic membrane protein A and related proteins